MNAMDRFVAATEPVLRKALKGTCIRAEYMLTPEGGVVRLRADLHSTLSFSDGAHQAMNVRTPEQQAEQWAEEAKRLAERHKRMLAEAATGVSSFAEDEPDIRRHGTMRVAL